MKNIATLALKSVLGNIDPTKKDNSFEVIYELQLFGMDYMIDEDFKVYLIEINTNPCLEIASTLLARLIPNMIENVLRQNIYVEQLLIRYFHHLIYKNGLEEKKKVFLRIFLKQISLN